MEEDLPVRSEYRSAMESLESAKRVAASGIDYWFAREIHAIFGYDSWSKFTPVIERAKEAMIASGIEPSHHIAQTSKMVAVGSGAMRNIEDFYLSRAACYLIAINGDPSKPQVAASQAYFATATREKEVDDALLQDEKRIQLREKVTTSFKAVSGVAKDAGVASQSQALFHDARYQGLYGMSGQALKGHKGLNIKENIFDRMGALELSANEFQMNLAAETIKSERVRGEGNAIRKNKEIAQKVRKTMTDSGSRAPELLPADEPIKEVLKRVKQRQRSQKKLS